MLNQSRSEGHLSDGGQRIMEWVSIDLPDQGLSIRTEHNLIEDTVTLSLHSMDWINKSLYTPWTEARCAFFVTLGHNERETQNTLSVTCSTLGEARFLRERLLETLEAYYVR